eukprot:6121991-Prorocentrum_lima.AAC.1
MTRRWNAPGQPRRRRHAIAIPAAIPQVVPAGGPFFSSSKSDHPTASLLWRCRARSPCTQA